MQYALQNCVIRITAQSMKLNTLISDPIATCFKSWQKKKLFKLIRYHRPTFVKHVLAPQDDFGMQKKLGK